MKKYKLLAIAFAMILTTGCNDAMKELQADLSSEQTTTTKATTVFNFYSSTADEDVSDESDNSLKETGYPLTDVEDDESEATTTTTAPDPAPPKYNKGEEIWIKGQVVDITGSALTLKDYDGFNWTVNCSSVEDISKLKNLVSGKYVKLTGDVTGNLKVDFVNIATGGKVYTASNFKKIVTTKAPTVYNPSSVNSWSYYGNGDNVLSNLKVENYAILVVRNSGEHNFVVKVYNNDTGYSDLLINTIGDYSGTVLIKGTGTYDVEIKSSGNWNLSAEKLGVTNGTTFRGTGDAVTNIFDSNSHNWKITNSNAEHNFVVRAHFANSKYSDLLVNEIGNYSGTVRSSDVGDMFFEIISDGNWTISAQS